ncbi:hypothetical protein MCOR27_008110 [Pyricularia oryzae]|uniref:Uncharacterized protein n=4 Tax=Pyricularia TaxID=48558 RepID=A0ABQ8NWY1_PYRGI|nr:uncharacterized protein MGG_07624 [Pyricularia oryzae 70-15]ELQ35264.1 hypothetical protein OOU_Y34scaffold00719g28 [Pyricularia oryzae Y34]KAH8846917.1 hypothetical protein MCOR01_000361 [Pyricularia oryzae]KAI6303351.1 hypothetical protein MCOR33_001440 [Pyricularia grisea]EHA51740.1 hypothetical protein MGG_07624 [Pyricularia oryzae 70-15]KAH9427913.1 hypothetical protein MCOR02_011413 [Pyricularia oryzae]
MKFQILYTTIAAGAVAALDMSNYAPKPGVPAEFKPFYEALVGQADNMSATTSFTDFFTSTGRQTTLTLDCQGPAAILKCKQGFLPPDGSKTLSHFPNTTFVVSNNDTATVFEVQGRIEHNYVKGNCSQNYYKTQYTVLKTDQRVEAMANLTPKPEHQVTWYHDYFIDPPFVPNSVPCDSLKGKQ